MAYLRPGYLDNDTYVSRYMQTDGGSTAMNVDGSVTPVTFHCGDHSGLQLITGRLMMYMESPTAMAGDLFGHLTALTNGLQFNLRGVEMENWKDNVDLITTLYDGNSRVVFGKADRHIFGRWSFYRAANGVVGLLALEHDLNMVVRDNLSALTRLQFKFQGFYETL